MAKDILIINGHDWSNIIQPSGCGWVREDLSGDNERRTKDGHLRRSRIAVKRTLSYKTIPASREQLEQLDDDLSAVSFSVTYKDLHGTYTRDFCCRSFETRYLTKTDVREVWGEAAFTLVEL